MSTVFDPYHKWLGIPPRDQPTNAYRLLGVELWESDVDVIENAADQRMKHLHAFQAGPHRDDSQRLLNEIAAAKLCLLDPRAKAAYDAQLLQALSARLPPEPAPEPAPTTIATPETSSAPQISQQRSSQASSSERGRKKPTNLPLEITKHVVGSIVGLGLGYIILGFLRPSWDGLGIAKNVRAALSSSPSDDSPDKPFPIDKNPPIFKPAPEVVPPPSDKPGPKPYFPTSPAELRSKVSTREDGLSSTATATAKKVGSARDGFLVLRSVGGYFLGDGEWFWFDANQEGEWYIGCDGVKEVSAGCLEVKTPVRWLFEEEVVKHRWDKAQQRIQLIHELDGFAVLSSAAGCFLDGAQGVRVYLDSNGFWYLEGRTNFNSAAEALVFRYREKGRFRAQVQEHHWSTGDAPRELLHESEGLCFISGMEGAFKSGDATFHCQPDPKSKRWVFTGAKSTDPTLHASAISLKFGPDVMKAALSAKPPPTRSVPAPLPEPPEVVGQQPVPEETVLESAKEKLKDELQRDARELGILAKEKRPAAERYALWLAAIDKAVADGDAAQAAFCVNGLADAFEIDAGARMLATLMQLKETADTPKTARALALAVIEQFDAAVKAGRTADLPALAALALAAARGSEDADLQRRATLKVIEAKKLAM